MDGFASFIGSTGVFNISPGNVAAGQTGLGVAPPLLPGDQVDGLQAFIRSGPTTDVSGADPSIEVYACNSPPASVAAARNGYPIMPLTSLPCVPHEFLNDAAQNVAWTYHGPIPFIHVVEQHGLYIAVVVTANNDATLVSQFLLRVFRRSRRD